MMEVMEVPAVEVMEVLAVEVMEVLAVEVMEVLRLGVEVGLLVQERLRGPGSSWCALLYCASKSRHLIRTPGLSNLPSPARLTSITL